MSATANRPKRHHWLPQSYLEGFCDDGTLWVYDRKTDQVREQTPVNTAVQGHYYSHEAEDGSKNPVVEEELLKVIDGWFPPLLGVLMNRGQFGWNDRNAMGIFVALLMLRTPSFENQVESFEKTLAQRVADLSFSNIARTASALATWEKETGKKATTTPEALYEFHQSGKYEIKVSRNTSIRLMLELFQQFAERLVHMRWVVVHVTNPRTSFVTSDRPLVVYLPPGRRAAGISTTGAVKTVPLHQNLLLTIGDQCAAPLECIHMDASDAAQVRSANEATASGSTRFVIGRDRSLVERVSSSIRRR